MHTLYDFVESLKEYGNSPAIEYEDKQRHSITYQQLYTAIKEYQAGFLSLGLKRGDKVMIIADNSPQWIQITLALNSLGIIDVPRGSDASAQDIHYIADHAQPKVVIVENDSLLEKIPSITSAIYCMGESKKIPLVPKHTSHRHSVGPLASDTATIIYTSGTTGSPKGVELTHGNILSNLEGIAKKLPMDHHDRFLSFLPPWHAFERMAKYMILSVGGITFHTSKDKVMDDCVSFRPTLLISVPKIWQRIYDQFFKKVNGSPLAFVLNAMIRSHLNYQKSPSLKNRVANKIVDAFLLKKLRKALGDNLRYAICGGAYLAPFLEDFFHAAKIPLVVGYGMTECSPVITIGNDAAPYSVGSALANVSLKIASNSEILVHGPNVMKGYYKDQEQTKKILKQHWLHTGDLGNLDKKGNLFITGRIKDTIVLDNGENVDPVKIESALTKDPAIEWAIVIGQNYKKLGVLIVSKESKKAIQAAIDSLVNKNDDFRTFEKLAAFRIITSSFEIGDELTPTLKPKRSVIMKKYSSLVEEIKEEIHNT